MTIRTRTAALVSSGLRSRGRAFPRQTEQGGNVDFVRSIFEQWAKGDATTEWADPDIEFHGPDLRGGQGIHLMASVWNDWLETVDDFDVVADEFLDAGNDGVLILARFIFGDKRSDAPSRVHRGVFRFILSGRKVVRLAVFIEREPIEAWRHEPLG